MDSQPPSMNGSNSNTSEEDAAIAIWKMRRLVKKLESCRGAGTSMISLIIRPKDQLSQIGKMLNEEFGTASNIKNRVNRQSVLGAITSTRERLRLYNKTPPNGLVVYCGEILTEEGKERKINIDFEPFKPVNTSLYLCDNKFHTEDLAELLESDDKFGFIVMDGHSCLFGTVAGSTRTTLHKFSVDLPKKHGRGGQSALRFSRLRDEKRHNYVRKVAETAVQLFIVNDKVNVTGLVLAGSADFKTELSQSDMFDPRLQSKIIKIVDVSFGGELGFNQAIDLAAEALQNVKFVQEKKVLQRFFDTCAREPGLVCFGIERTLMALQEGALEVLICYSELEVVRNTLKNSKGETVIVYSGQENEPKGRAKFMDKETGQEMEKSADPQPLLEWLTENIKDFGCHIEFVTDKSQEGNQFCKGFGGIGGILRFQLDLDFLEALNESQDEYYDDDDSDSD